MRLGTGGKSGVKIVGLHEAELHEWDPQVCQEFLLYYGPSKDQYEFFWCQFPVSLYQWLKRLAEYPEYRAQQERTIQWTWTVSNLATLQQVDHQIT